MKKIMLTVFLFIVTFSSCNKFEYSVYETGRIEKGPELTTEFNIQRLQSLPKKDTLHIAVFGDSQRFYDDVEDLIAAINSLSQLDAVIITGDLTDFALAWELNLINERLKLLKVPFITVVGNHDLLAKGPKLYEEVYGPINYSFIWNDVKFVVHDSNGREANFNGTVPNINWIKSQLVDTASYNSCMFVSHVSVDNNDFDPSLKLEYRNILNQAKNTILSTNGHLHNINIYKIGNEKVWYLNSGSPSNRIFSYLKVYPNANSDHLFDFVPVGF